MNTVYVGHPTEWGNQFDESPKGLKRYEGAIKILIEKYSGFDIKILRGKNLACWCPLDKPCHADILLRLANKA